MSSASAVHDRGYRRYDGPREARGGRVRALFLAGLRRSLGLRRSWKAKVAPWSLILLSFAPAELFLLLLLAGVETDSSTFSYGGYLQATTVVLLPLAAVAAAELVCPERRSKLVTLIFTRPVTAEEYLGAKLGVLAALLSLVTLGPLAILFAGNAFSAPDPAAYLTEHSGDLVRILAASSVVILFYAALALAVAALFDRRGLAIVTVIGGVLVASVVVNTLTALAVTGGASTGAEWLVLLDPAALPYRVVEWIFEQRPIADGPSGRMALAALVLYVVASTAAFLRYSRRAGG